MNSTTIADVRERRDELRDRMGDLEDALASAVPGREQAWTGRVSQALDALDTALSVHVRVAEEPGGLFDQVMADAPRLEHAMAALRADHRRLAVAIGSLRGVVARQPTDTTATRADGLRLLDQLARHRHLGADLVYEAYMVDLGSPD